ncbi:Ig-like domain-containing protein [Roseisolibacter sp. H3M3-2]|uniref:Ig-like domain-containing protein n=1 Tax=Roseisolibacter sp. H3M3-2 TaxID=3031323 RepID=UPI0023DB63E0|nr:Ig-like domain-containing protein [Roseisolibacter sp. H3M3-2]MDF1505138.1 Ig-like domain-containing protein [Roseisolibacter sp. H3M3-2]
MTGTALTWSSSDTTVLVVSSSGAARGVRPGRATLRVSAGAVSAEASRRVVAAPVADVRIRGADSVVVGASAALTAEPTDPTGRALLGRTVTWGVADTTVARVDGAGVVRGIAVGRTTVTASVGAVTGTRAVVVRGPLAASLAFVRVPDSLWTGLRDSVRAQFTDSAGRPVTDGRAVTYSSDAPTVVEVQADGRIRPLAAGTATIRAAGDRLTATRTVTVRVAPVAQVVVAPDTLVVLNGSGSQLYPILVDLGGVRQFRRAVAYQSDNPAVATVSATGAVRAAALGTTTVRVTSERGVGTAVVRVIEPPADRFRVELRFVTPSERQFEEAFRNGVADWERAIMQTGGPVSLSIPAGACFNDVAVNGETVRHLLIFVRLENIDGRGGTLGQAGACSVRTTTLLPLVGGMRFDTTDLRALYNAGTLQAVVTHEIGHVLGVSRSIWNIGNRLLAPAVATAQDPRFVGRRGALASAGMGFTNLGEGAMLETEGGTGTAGSHWREQTYTIELMTGFMESPTVPGTQLERRPMSLLTIESLGDVGYQVAHSAADVFGRLLESPLSAAALADRLPTLFRTAAPASLPHADPLPAPRPR